MSGKEEAAFYKDPTNLRAGRRVTPSGRSKMGGHVPVRFPEDVIAQVKILAERDGLTVSSWIRRLVLQEIERRSSSTTGHAYWSDITWVSKPPTAEPTSVSPMALVQNSEREKRASIG